MSNRSEAQVRSEIRTGFMHQGWPFCALVGNEHLAGWPDYLAILTPDTDFPGVALFVECKREGEHSRKLQVAIQERLRRAGAIVVSDCMGWGMVVEGLGKEWIMIK